MDTHESARLLHYQSNGKSAEMQIQLVGKGRTVTRTIVVDDVYDDEGFLGLNFTMSFNLPVFDDEKIDFRLAIHSWLTGEDVGILLDKKWRIFRPLRITSRPDPIDMKTAYVM